VVAPQPVGKRGLAGRAAISDHDVLGQRAEAEPGQKLQEGGIDGLLDAHEITWLCEQERALGLVG
jgi:hypothetical protein